MREVKRARPANLGRSARRPGLHLERELGHVVKADGRFRIFAFAKASNPAASSSAIRQLCEFLAEGQESPIRKYRRRDEDIDAVIDVRAVFQQAHRELAIEAMSLRLAQRS